MKVKIHILLLGIIVIGNNISKAQEQYIDTNYKYSYQLKLQGVNSLQTAKSASIDLARIFDSNHQLFNASDSIITIRSAFSCDDSRLINRLQDYGYPVLYFKKTMYDISSELKKSE